MIKFTDLNENDLVHFTYDDKERVVRITSLEVTGPNKYLQGEEVTDEDCFKKFNFNKVEDLEVLANDVDGLDHVYVEEISYFEVVVVAGSYVVHIPKEEPEELEDVTVRKVNGKRFVFVGDKQLCEAPEDL